MQYPWFALCQNNFGYSHSKTVLTFLEGLTLHDKEQLFLFSKWKFGGNAGFGQGLYKRLPGEVHVLPDDPYVFQVVTLFCLNKGFSQQHHGLRWLAGQSF